MANPRLEAHALERPELIVRESSRHMSNAAPATAAT
jgi:hypothetical protein